MPVLQQKPPSGDPRGSPRSGPAGAARRNPCYGLPAAEPGETRTLATPAG
jgi:hypothetical protein